MLIKYAGPDGLRAAGRGNVLRWARNHTRKDPATLIDAVLKALGEQSVTVAGTQAVELVIPRVAAQIKELRHQRAIVAEEVEKLLDDFPLSGVLMSMPGVGIKTAATILLTIGDAGTFRTAGHLAAYAGIAPVTRRSGTSIRGEFPARSGNKQLKKALFRSAWIASCHDPASKAYYARKRAEGRNTTPPSSAWPGAAATSSTRCSETGHSTRKKHPRPLDEKHRDTPHRRHRPDRRHRPHTGTNERGPHCQRNPQIPCQQRTLGMDQRGRDREVPGVPADSPQACGSLSRTCPVCTPTKKTPLTRLLCRRRATPFGKFGAGLGAVRPDDLAAPTQSGIRESAPQAGRLRGSTKWCSATQTASARKTAM
jgi:hypothetical protein